MYTHQRESRMALDLVTVIGLGLAALGAAIVCAVALLIVGGIAWRRVAPRAAISGFGLVLWSPSGWVGELPIGAGDVRVTLYGTRQGPHPKAVEIFERVVACHEKFRKGLAEQVLRILSPAEKVECHPPAAPILAGCLDIAAVAVTWDGSWRVSLEFLVPWDHEHPWEVEMDDRLEVVCVRPSPWR